MKTKFTSQVFSAIVFTAAFLLIHVFAINTLAATTFIVNSTADSDDGTSLTPLH
jgi:hypothetical protein